MSMYDTEIDERFWDLYLNWCRAHEVTPTLKDFMVWMEDQDYDLPEFDWSGYED